LKKLWANLKQSQREKQSHLATGGGSQETEANIDPDVNIAPHLMQTAPTLFTSNMTEAEINGMYDIYSEIFENFINFLYVFQRNVRLYLKCHHYLNMKM